MTEIRAITDEEYGDYIDVLHVAFGETPAPETVDYWRTVLELERTVAAFEGTRMVGTAGVISFDLTVPGGSVPMGGVTAVGVLPSHRRRGLLRTMMRRMLDDCRERGEPVAGLLASESAIYGRYGYGMATETAHLELETAHAAFARPVAPPAVELVGVSDAAGAVAPIYERARASRAGMPDVSGARWGWLALDPESERQGAGPRQVAVLDDRAYAVYRLKPAWKDGLADHEVVVEDLVALDPDSYASIWRWVLDLDLAGRVSAGHRPLDEPLGLLLADPRRLRRRVTDWLWLAILDVPAALEGRRYRRPGRLTVTVVEGFAPGVEGTYGIEVQDGRATVDVSTGEPDLVLTAAALGAAYLGGTALRRLAAAGHVTERTPGALDSADAMFATTPAPWCPFEF
jgi:predicted acetyltransferase